MFSSTIFLSIFSRILLKFRDMFWIGWFWCVRGKWQKQVLYFSEMKLLCGLLDGFQFNFPCENVKMKRKKQINWNYQKFIKNKVIEG